MKGPIKYLILVTLYFSFAISFFSNAASDPCFVLSKQNTPECNHYQYDKLNAYFLDAVNTEQQVVISRVKSRATGQLMFAHYDFALKCLVNCAVSDNDVLQESLWAFRNALLENRLYEKVILPCDPTLEVCCDSRGCNEIYSDDKSSTMSLSVQQDVEQVTQGRRGNIRREVESALQSTDAAVNLYQNLSRDSHNAADFQYRHASQLRQPSIFSLLKVTDGSYKVIKLVAENTYEAADGILRHDPDQNLFSAGIEHNWGNASNYDLRDFLERAFNLRERYSCTQSTECKDTSVETRCSVKMTCR